MLQLYHSSNADKIDSVISYSGGTMAAFVNWSSGKPGSALVNTKIKGPGPHFLFKIQIMAYHTVLAFLV